LVVVMVMGAIFALVAVLHLTGVYPTPSEKPPAKPSVESGPQSTMTQSGTQTVDPFAQEKEQIATASLLIQPDDSIAGYRKRNLHTSAPAPVEFAEASFGASEPYASLYPPEEETDVVAFNEVDMMIVTDSQEPSFLDLKELPNATQPDGGGDAEEEGTQAAPARGAGEAGAKKEGDDPGGAEA
jgi:hypothetical protein